MQQQSFTLTITKRKKASDETSTAEDRLLSGMKSSCDACSADVTHSVHFRCAELKERPEGAPDRLACPDFDLCVQVRLQPRGESDRG